jgi:peptide/nickel transport system substrate-binding protein
MAGRRGIWTAAAVAAAFALVASGCGRSAGGNAASGNISATKGLVATTTSGAKQVSSITWAVYRDVNSLDPIYAFDYPENTAISLMCESLLRQAPDGSLQPGIATLTTPSPTKLVFTIKPGVTFWDGHPVTSADVVYSLDRQTNPALGGFYGEVFNRVASITATGPEQVTIMLKQPDYWLQGELSSMAGVVIEKSYAQAQGKNYGTPAGGIMCTGAYEFKSWKPGVGVTAVANPHYWNPAVKPLVQQILIKGAPDVSSFTSGMLTGGIQGSYSFGLPSTSWSTARPSRCTRVPAGPPTRSSCAASREPSATCASAARCRWR